MKILCHIGLHRWIHVRTSHSNSWEGKYCSRCMKVREKFLGFYRDSEYTAHIAAAILKNQFTP